MPASTDQLRAAFGIDGVLKNRFLHSRENGFSVE
jgi:hypothetical protein